ncbi:mechanosensitive ion channel family protein [Haliea sp. E1-2-M8]|uniref:mechanosensitive ion channel family protein n=1 Tax=Haliea sp. E1-2-M8 TaxID=3064706 RepID=UPI00271BEC9E|nr:mechanosensitive ion channel family protein [Haliea sp. E1-2-M8]MDO8862780.1 mechanosensitive ion channel family protein [Haliea sp. E1-2-M8]
MEIASITDFWELLVTVWQHGVYGIDFVHILVALLVFLIALAIRNLFTRHVLGALQRRAQKTDSQIDDVLLEAIRKPLRFVPVVLGVFFATSVLKVDDSLAAFLYNINRSLVVFTLFWTFHQLTGPLGVVLQRTNRFLTEAMIDWIVKLSRVLFIVVGVATILELWGIAVGPVIAGLGLFGVAVALGAQDLFKNLIAGFFVIGERRFQPGDWINVEGIVEGTVLQIGFRTTTVRRFDRAPVYVPNARLADNAVTNFSRMTHRRIRWMLGLEYRTSLEQLREIRDAIERYILDSDEFAKPDEVATFVRIDSFNDSSIDILLYCFTHTTVWGEWLEIKEHLAYRIKEIVEAAGAGFAFPSRSLYLENQADAPEVYPLSPPRDSVESPAATADAAAATDRDQPAPAGAQAR